MKVSHHAISNVNFPVVWLEKSEQETMQPQFAALQDGAVAVFTLDMLKDWAEHAADTHEHYPRESALDMSNEFSSLVMNRPGSKVWTPVTVEVRPSSLELLIRYEVDGDRAVDSYQYKD